MSGVTQTRRQYAFRRREPRINDPISKRYYGALLALFLIVGAVGGKQETSARQARAGGLVVEFTSVPNGLEGWVAQARRSAPRWFATIRARFSDHSGARTVVVDFSSQGSFVARTARDRVLLSTSYLSRNKDDLGVLAHEMTHVVQGYPSPSPFWLTEGIADYVRYYGIEPNSPRAGFDISRDSFTRGYQPAAFLLRAVEREHGCGAVDRLNSAMRRGADIDAVWRQITGLSPAQSWGNLVASPDAARRVGRPDPSPCFRGAARFE